MAADAYIQAAAAQLMQAANAVKAEADQLRSDLVNFERNMTSDINSQEIEARVHNTEINGDKDDQERAALRAQLGRIQSELTQKKQELDKTRAALQKQISEKDNKVASLQREAQNLQGKASAFR
jgi:chromosome segregation ATPase